MLSAHTEWEEAPEVRTERRHPGQQGDSTGHLPVTLKKFLRGTNYITPTHRPPRRPSFSSSATARTDVQI
jgi:hypothetical protein